MAAPITLQGLWAVVSEEPNRRKKTYEADWLFGSVIPVKSFSLWCLVLFEGPHPAVFRTYYWCCAQEITHS